MEAALFRNALPAHFAHPGTWEAAAQCCRPLAALWAMAAARLQRPGMPVAPMVRAVSRAGTALFLLAAAEHLGHAGLLSRMMGH